MRREEATDRDWHDAFNALLVVAVGAPWFFLTHMLNSDECSHHSWCAHMANEPLLGINVVFFVLVDVLFWVIALLQGSTWLIDPYWTFLPLLINHYFEQHPLCTHASPSRALLAKGILFVWSARLTHNYFRREGWRFGEKEDWRFTHYRRKLKGWWPLASFFIVYVSQHVMLVGLCLPLYAVHFVAPPVQAVSDTIINTDIGVLDGCATVVCFVGIVVGMFADNQLYAFMQTNEQRRRQGKDRVLVLDSGLWYLSRHPNHFGEQLFWFGVALFALAATMTSPDLRWCCGGLLVNHLCDNLATLHLIEGRMLANPTRTAAYKAYQQRTPILIPSLPRLIKGCLSSRKKSS